MRDKITYPFNIKIYECNYLFMQESKLNHITKFVCVKHMPKNKKILCIHVYAFKTSRFFLGYIGLT